jgi:hypothetical protein
MSATREGNRSGGAPGRSTDGEDDENSEGGHQE